MEDDENPSIHALETSHAQLYSLISLTICCTTLPIFILLLDKESKNRRLDVFAVLIFAQVHSSCHNIEILILCIWWNAPPYLNYYLQKKESSIQLIGEGKKC